MPARLFKRAHHPDSVFVQWHQFNGPMVQFLDVMTCKLVEPCLQHSALYKEFEPTSQVMDDDELIDLRKAYEAVSNSKHTALRVMEFHKAFDHAISYKPEVPSFDVRRLRVNLILEELGEFIAASGMMSTQVYGMFHNLQQYLLQAGEAEFHDAPQPSIIEAADALGDIDYVVAGSNLVWGIPAEAVAIAIHESNMSKLDVNGQPIKREDGKVLKSINYFPPRIRAVLWPNEAAEKLEQQYQVGADKPQGDLLTNFATDEVLPGDPGYPKNPQSSHRP